MAKRNGTRTTVGPVQSGIPLPSRMAGVRGTSKYPLRMLRVGQSFEVSGKTAPARLRGTISNLLQVHPEFKGRFATRKTEQGVRVWRVK